MAQAHGNPEELRLFANALEHYLNTVEEETGQLDGAFSQLGDTWDDQKRREFEEVYQQLRGALNNFHEQATFMRKSIPTVNKQRLTVQGLKLKSKRTWSADSRRKLSRAHSNPTAEFTVHRSEFIFPTALILSQISF